MLDVCSGRSVCILWLLISAVMVLPFTYIFALVLIMNFSLVVAGRRFVILVVWHTHYET